MEKEQIDWIEKAAVENFKAHFCATEALEKHTTTTLTVLFAGMAGGLAYAAKAVDNNAWTWLSFGAAAFTLYIAILAALLVVKCMWIDEYPQLHNEPKILLDVDPKYSFEQIRKFELENMQGRIQQAVDRNAKVAGRLNKIRLAVIASPGVFIVAAVGWAAMAA